MIREYRTYEIEGIHVVFGITDLGKIRLLHFSSKPFDCADMEKEDRFYDQGFALVQVNIAGLDRPFEYYGNTYASTAPGLQMLFDSIEESDGSELVEEGITPNEGAYSKVLTIRQHHDETGLRLTTTMAFFSGTPVMRIVTTAENAGSEPFTLEYVSTFAYLGVEKEGPDVAFDKKLRVYVPHNGWQRELAWQAYTFPELGLCETEPHLRHRTSKTVELTNTGNWSTKLYLPMGYVENTLADTSLFFQVEHSGSWHYEFSQTNNHIFLKVSGPTETQSSWFKTLAPGDSFTTVAAEVGVSAANFSEAMASLTKARRLMRRPNEDNERLPVIFNDYMNCLRGDPTTAKELPLIDAAALAGCEYFVIDCGWYDIGKWWNYVGEWKESRERFPNGIREVTDYIRSKGMIPGIWVEPESVGVLCELGINAPDDWFFCRHGKRVHYRGRWQLDFRNPEVRDHITAVFDRLIRDYGVGYFKVDYNMEPGIGTDLYADSPGEGLLEHGRAYRAWLDFMFERYPDLIIENCSSGGLRMDYAQLRRCSIQSTSDQEDYVNYAVISCNAPTAVTPEQAAVWSYPMRNRWLADDEDAVFNMVNAMMLRVHQSGHLAELSAERFDIVREGLATYRDTMRPMIRQSLPAWPIGLAHTPDPWCALMLKHENRAFLAVWRKDSEAEATGTIEPDTLAIPLAKDFPGATKARLLFPKADYADHTSFELVGDELRVTFATPIQARIFELEA